MASSLRKNTVYIAPLFPKRDHAYRYFLRRMLDAVTIPKRIIKDYLDLTTGLLNGSITGRYEETGFRKREVARLGLAELWYQCDA